MLKPTLCWLGPVAKEWAKSLGRMLPNKKLDALIAIPWVILHPKRILAESTNLMALAVQVAMALPPNGWANIQNSIGAKKLRAKSMN